METIRAAARSSFLTARMGVVFGVVLIFIFLAAAIWALVMVMAGSIFASLLLCSVCMALLMGAHYLRRKKKSGTASSYIDVGIEIFFEFRPGAIFCGFLLGGLIAWVLASWQCYLV